MSADPDDQQTGDFSDGCGESPDGEDEQAELEYCAAYYCSGDCGQPHNQKEVIEALDAYLRA